MKILYSAFDPVPWPKGSGTRIEATVRALAEAGAKVHLHTPAPPRPMEGFAPLLEAEGVTHRPVVVEHENFIDRVLAFRETVRDLLEREQFDAAIFRSTWEGVPILKAVPRVIYEVHGFPSVELVSHYPAVRDEPNLMDRLIAEENLCLQRAQLLFTPSMTSRHFLMRRGVHPNKIRIVPNSVEVGEAPPLTPQPEAGPPYRIGYMGTLAPWQGIGLLLEAIALLRRSMECTLVVAGTRKGRWMRKIRDLSRRLKLRNTLEFHGPLPKERLFEVLQSCHALAAPLPNDPRNGMQGCCPIKLLEYMTCNRPILSTRIAPVQELLVDGETGVLVQPGSAASLASGMRHLLMDPPLAEGLAANAREVVLRDFTRARFRHQIAQIWAEIQELPTSPLSSALKA